MPINFGIYRGSKMPIKLNELIVMQENLRHTSQIEKMIYFVKNGGFWTEDVLKKYAESVGTRVCPLMEVVCFPDGKRMIHDGHHRIVSIYLGGRDYLREDEFILKYWDYKDYLNVNIDNRWVTPFDPRTEVRVPDIGEFKKKAIDLFAADPEKAREFIFKNKMSYIKDRNISWVSSLARNYLREIDK
jgi:hypothetical protein